MGGEMVGAACSHAQPVTGRARRGAGAGAGARHSPLVWRSGRTRPTPQRAPRARRDGASREAVEAPTRIREGGGLMAAHAPRLRARRK